MKEVKLVNFKIENKTLKKFDETCGIIPRFAYLRRMIENEIKSVHSRILQDSTMNGTAQNNNQKV